MGVVTKKSNPYFLFHFSTYLSVVVLFVLFVILLNAVKVTPSHKWLVIYCSLCCWQSIGLWCHWACTNSMGNGLLNGEIFKSTSVEPVTKSGSWKLGRCELNNCLVTYTAQNWIVYATLNTTSVGTSGVHCIFVLWHRSSYCNSVINLANVA